MTLQTSRQMVPFVKEALSRAQHNRRTTHLY